MIYILIHIKFKATESKFPKNTSCYFSDDYIYKLHRKRDNPLKTSIDNQSPIF